MNGSVSYRNPHQIKMRESDEDYRESSPKMMLIRKIKPRFYIKTYEPIKGARAKRAED
jgi:hypothetical protein